MASRLCWIRWICVLTILIINAVLLFQTQRYGRLIETQSHSPCQTALELLAFFGGKNEPGHAHVVGDTTTYSALSGVAMRVHEGITQTVNLGMMDADFLDTDYGATDGQYVYYLARSNEGGGTVVGKVARIDIHNFSATTVIIRDFGAVVTNIDNLLYQNGSIYLLGQPFFVRFIGMHYPQHLARVNVATFEIDRLVPLPCPGPH